MNDPWYRKYLSDPQTEADIIDGKTKAEAYREAIERSRLGKGVHGAL